MTTMKLTILEALAALHTHWDRATTAVGAHADIDQRWIDGLLGHAVSANHQLSLIGDLAESTVADAARRALVQDCLVLGALALDGVLGYAGDPADVAQPGDPTLADQVAALEARFMEGWSSPAMLACANERLRAEATALSEQLEAARTAFDAAHAPGGHALAVDARIAALAGQLRQAQHGMAVAESALDRLREQLRLLAGGLDGN
jgi:hypothetical protein